MNVLVNAEHGIGTIVLNRPEKLNALDYNTFKELGEALDAMAADREVRVVVITGVGRAFCSGGDIGVMPGSGVAATPAEMREKSRWVQQTVILKLWNLPKPSIASINGLAAGGGLDLALAASIRIASDTARFSEIYVRRGLPPDCGGTYLLPRIVGIAKACELIFSGDWVDAKEAERIGLVNKVVPADQLESATKEMAGKIAQAAPIAVSLAKQSIYRGLNTDFESGLESETFAQVICFLTEDHKEAIAAFREKRPPMFKGR